MGISKRWKKELGISYPTVRNRSDIVIEELGYRENQERVLENEKGDSQEGTLRRQGILEALERGEITAQEATRQMRNQSGKD